MNKLLVIILSLSFAMTASASKDVIEILTGESVVYDGDLIDNPVLINGGSLIMRNGATITDRVTVKNSGRLSMHTGSLIKENLYSTNAASIQLLDSKIAGHSIISDTSFINMAGMTFRKAVWLFNHTSVSIDISKMNGGLTVYNSGDLSLSNSSVGRRLVVRKINFALLNSSSFNNVRIIDNTLVAIINSPQISGRVTAKLNDEIFFNDNVTTNFRKPAVFEDNIDTSILNNSFAGTLSITPGAGNCEESNNAYNELIGGCS